MANMQFFVPNGGPGTNELIRVALLETDQTGVFQLSFEEVGENTTRPSLAASIAAATNKIIGGLTPVVLVAAATETLTALDSGRITVATLASGTQTFTLPVANVLGLDYTFVNVTAAGEILVNPGNGTDIFQIKATVDQGASVVTAAGVGIKNTAATNVVGDSIRVISNGAGRWIMITQSGIWASQ